MPDIVSEVTLPSNGKLYNKDIQYKNQLRAPRLKDRGFGDTTRKYKLQASILDKTLIQPLGMSTYDLHTADFVYLNLRQRQLSKGNTPYKISVKCTHCGERHDVDINLDELKVKMLDKPLDLTYTTLDGSVLQLSYITPRMLEECIDKANEFKEEYKDTDLSFEALKTRELFRFVIKTVDGKVLSYPRMTDFLDNLYDGDIEGMTEVLYDFDFGVQTLRTLRCPSCGKKITYTVPLG